MGESNASLMQQLLECQAEQERFKKRCEDLAAELNRRQESYMRREARQNLKITQLQSLIEKLQGEQKEGAEGMQSAETRQQFILAAQQSITEGVQNLLDKQKSKIQVEESAVLKGFRDRLREVEDRILAERTNRSGEQSGWVEQAMELREELENMKGIAGRLESEYKNSQKECQRLKTERSCHLKNGDLQAKRLVAVKKENNTLKSELKALHGHLQTLLGDCADSGICSEHLRNGEHKNSGAEDGNSVPSGTVPYCGCCTHSALGLDGLPHQRMSQLNLM
ncbi:unnamed protein product [Ostreobium quekettii]|uniref:Uncharacterized protein n=1 Tax=Ostreobium quekettii TaxID=121088 RepID=A0A8S1J8F9_9CHLO|nr:unnamed protein product [Ostreobium quekettii]